MFGHFTKLCMKGLKKIQSFSYWGIFVASGPVSLLFVEKLGSVVRRGGVESKFFHTKHCTQEWKNTLTPVLAHFCPSLII